MTKAALLAQQKLAQIACDLQHAMQEFSNEPSLARLNSLSETLQGLEHPMRALDYADEEDRSMELLRALEVHGDGLVPFSSTGTVFQANDVLITAARNLALVTRVNENGEILEIAGSAKGKAMIAGEFVLAWRPERQARAWLAPGEEAAIAYSDLGRAMLYMIRQWGNKQSDAGHDVTTGVGFFVDAVNAPGLDLDARELHSFSGPADVLAYCAERGEGLQTYAPDTTLVPGDLVLLNKRGAWGVITRRSADDRIEALVGGLAGKGQLREPTGAARMVRGLAVEDIRKIWRPDKKPRKSR